MKYRDKAEIIRLLILLGAFIFAIFSCQSGPGSVEQSESSYSSQPAEEIVITEIPDQSGPEQEVPDTDMAPPPLEVPIVYPRLSNSSIEKIILKTIPRSFLPVTDDGGHIKILYRDLDQNGYQDAFLLVIKNNENAVSGFRELSDVSRMLKNDQEPVDFFLSVYLQLKGGMISMFRIPVGTSSVLSDFSVVPVKYGSELPLGINISFQTTRGTDREWIVFSSYNRFSLFSFTENISSYSETYDIDGDKIVDIVEWEDGLEEGTGYETYLTWYKWNGREYREYMSTNVVRNLNKFLEQSRLFLAFGQNEEFFRYVLSPEAYKYFISSGNNSPVWLEKIFRPVPGSISEKDELAGCTRFKTLIFPQFFENPFSPRDENLRICNINVRFSCSDGYSIIRTARILMNRNPFSKQEFSFYIE